MLNKFFFYFIKIIFLQYVTILNACPKPATYSCWVIQKILTTFISGYVRISQPVAFLVGQCCYRVLMFTSSGILSLYRGSPPQSMGKQFHRKSLIYLTGVLLNYEIGIKINKRLYSYLVVSLTLNKMCDCITDLKYITSVCLIFWIKHFVLLKKINQSYKFSVKYVNHSKS